MKQEARQRRRANRKPSVLLQEFWNLPNMLTVGRMAIIPVFVWFMYDADPVSSFWAGIIFAGASLTDIVDGYLARKWNLVTIVGKFLDPLADKLIVLAALVMMVRLGRVAAVVVIVLLAREFIVTGLRTVAAAEGMIIAAGNEGKLKTAFQLVGIICLCVHYVHPLDFVWIQVPVDFNFVGKVLVYSSTALSVWSAGVYFRAFLTKISPRKPAQSA